MYRSRVCLPSLPDKVMSTAEAADLIRDSMTVGMSGFTRADGAKAVPQALTMRAKERPLRISLMIGASLGNDLSRQLTEANVLTRRILFQVDSALCKTINAGEVMFIDQRLSETVEQLRNHQLKLPNIAVIEAATITEQGHIVLTTPVGNSASFAIFAKQAIIEINLVRSTNLEGLHDIYIPTYRPAHAPIPPTHIDDHIDSMAIPIPPEKIVTIVINDQPDSPSTMLPPDSGTQAIANHLIDFFRREVDAGRMNNSLGPLQAGIDNVANTVMCSLIESPFEGLTVCSEVLQGPAFDLIGTSKLRFASGNPITLSPRRDADVFDNLECYKDKLVLHPQEISNHPEVVHHLGIIGIGAVLEFDIYGSTNSAHTDGTGIMNNISDSGDFARNARLAIFVTKSIAKGGSISDVVPMVSHVDHTEHDIDILITKQGLANLRNLAPRERTRMIIENCVHPSYQAPLLDYFGTACVKGGHMPYLLREALAWHLNLEEHGHMLAD